MAGEQRLEIRQGQAMVMTPQLQQSIKMLQLSALELQQYITEQVDQNPLLEIVDPDAAPESSFSDNEEEIIEEIFPSDDNLEGFIPDMAGNGDISDIASGKSFAGDNDHTLDSNYDEVWDTNAAVSDIVYDGNNDSQHYNGVRNHRSESNYSFEDNADSGQTLREHILEQLYVDIIHPAQRMIAVYLTDMLDDSGYISEDVSLVAERLKCDVAQVEEVLLLLQQCDPAGVFARSLSECLALQLRDKDHLDPAIKIMLDHLDMVAQNDIKGLQKLCSLGTEDIQDMIAEIKSLNPKPGSSFNRDTVQSIQPDIFLKRKPDGGWVVELNNEVLPKVLLNRQYYQQVSSGHVSKDDKKYLTEQLTTANWLVRALDQRAQTILKVATELVQRQHAFFTQGIHHLRPMTLSDIAEAVDMHESTVSRVTTNKYIATPIGVFEMKYFFSSSLNSTSGEEDISSTTVKYLIKSLVDAESPSAILSDEDLVTMLQAKNITVARRTVAKYREAMGISSSVQRRKEKRI